MQAEMTGVCDVKANCCLSYGYPRCNCHGVPQKIEARLLLVTGVRDIWEQPLEPETLAEYPTCKRGRWLITGLDLHCGEERSFWRESMVDLAVIDPRAIPARPLRVVVVSKNGKHLAEETFPDLDREVFCDHFNARSSDCFAVAMAH